MKLTRLLLTIFSVIFCAQITFAGEIACQDPTHSRVMKGGVDVWPWSLSKPFPWEDVSGYWKLGNDENSYVRLNVLSTSNKRKILSIWVYGDGICSKPYAKGTGYIDINEKNVVRSLLNDEQYRYIMKMALFDARDISDKVDTCDWKIMAVSMQVIGRSWRGENSGQPLDPNLKETHNMVLKKVPVDPVTACKK
jgi:hypothetical protein